jgi:predicted nucleic acid-binding OB-fold protein
VRVQLEVCTDSSVEVDTQEAIRAKEYTDKDIDEIVRTITFGKTLNDQERNQLEEVVQKIFKAFSRNKGEFGFTTLIEHEIDLLHETPVKMKHYKLSFENRKLQLNTYKL